MKILLLLLIISTVKVNAQSNNFGKSYNAKYQYQMDDYFLENRKLIVHLDTLVGLLFDELDSARSCDERGNPDYYVSIVVGAHYLKDKNFTPDGFIDYGRYKKEKYKFTTSFGFNSFLLLKDKAHTVLKIYYITNKDEVFEHLFSKEFDPTYQSVTALANVRVINPITNQINSMPISSYGPWEYLNTSDKQFDPTIIEKNQIVLAKLLELQPVH